MAFFKLVMQGGHVGAGKSFDFVRYYEAADMMSAWLGALSLSRVKKNPNGTGICSVEPVGLEEYFRGRRRERHDPYLQRRG